MIIDNIENLMNYISPELTPIMKDIISKINHFEVGEYQLSNKVVVKRIDTHTHYYEDTKIESHRNHVDIQIPLNITEHINVYKKDGAKIKKEYDPIKDVEFYEHAPPIMMSESYVHPKQFIYLSPNELHQPQIAENQPEEIKNRRKEQ